MFTPTFKRLTILLTLISLILLLTTFTALGQEGDRHLSDQAERAPVRDPLILEQQTLRQGSQTVIEIPASADTYLASNHPDLNYGSHDLYLGYNQASPTAYGAERILLRFAVEDYIPTNAMIDSAQMRLRLFYSIPSDDAPMGTALRRLASSWNEFNVTWNSEPTWTPISKITYVDSALDWYDWDVTGVVADWVAGVHPNYGVEIIGDETVQYRERAFYSRETSALYFPRVVVTYTVSSDTEAPMTTVDPLPAYSNSPFSVSWQGTDSGGSGIDYYDVQVRTDSGEWQDWLTGVTITSAEYGSGTNGRQYEFRARAVDLAGNIEAYGEAEAETTVDTQPPTVSIDPLPAIINSDSFTVSWSGTDSGSGIQYYDVQYQYDTDPWTLWLPQTLVVNAPFNNALDGRYAFEVRAVDNVGNVELFTEQPEAAIVVDVNPPFLIPQSWQPVILSE